VKVLAIVQHKGGVGKTTIAVNLAAGLADAGKSTVLIDMDPQGGASRYMNVEPNEDVPHLADVLTGRTDFWGVGIKAPGVEKPGTWSDMDADGGLLCVVPADLALAGLNLKDPNRLRDALNLERPTPLKTIVIDTPPGWGMLTVNALVAATDVIAPAELKPLSLMALVDLVGMIADVRKEYNPKLNPTPWVVPSKVERLRLTTECMEDLNATFPGKVLPTIRQSARVGEAPGFHQTLSRYAPDSIGAEDFAALTKAVLKKVF